MSHHHHVVDPSFLSLVDPDLRCRNIATGFGFSEGPVWNPAEQQLLFSDIPHSIRYGWNHMVGSFEVLNPSHKGNGLTYDRAMNLIACEHATSSVVKFAGGKREVLASHYDGQELNAPNDLIVAADGAIWFSDPTYGRMPGFGVERDCELDFRGVYRLSPETGEVALVVDKSLFSQPNGLCFSPDEKHLYVNDTEQANIRVFDVAGGRLSNMRLFADGMSDPDLPGVPDGMKCDAAGNIWCTGPGGVWVFAPDGRLLGRLSVPEVVGNLCWGGSDWRTLFITASTSLYALDVKVGPRPEPFMQGRI